MAQLVQMRQRIKAIETIKKITHAMRLISMSTHSRIRGKIPVLKYYNQEVSDLFDTIRATVPQWTNGIVSPEQEPGAKPLVILIGSQKGLCGTFNTNLFKTFEKTTEELKFAKINIISVGKKAVDYLASRKKDRIVKEFPEITVRNFTDVSQEIIAQILKAKTPYSSVRIVSNELKTFFVQTPKVFDLLPLAKQNEKADTNTKKDESQESSEDYIWHQDKIELLDNLANQYIAAQINTLLLESLLAEQAARFLSMDTANRNAKTLLEETTLQYNKLRQWKITKELTELSTNF